MQDAGYAHPSQPGGPSIEGPADLREYTYVPQGSGIVYITITPGHREGSKCTLLSARTALEVLSFLSPELQKPLFFENMMMHGCPDDPQNGHFA